MNIDYRKYNFEDFARDERFRQWILNHDTQSEKFWHNWLLENPDCTDRVNLAKAFLYALEEKDTSLKVEELEQITDRIAEEKPRIIPFWQTSLFRAAASLLLILGIGFVGIRYFNNPANEGLTALKKISPILTENYIEKENTQTSNQQLTLEDGSIVTLYPKSKLRYPKQFSPQMREVYLTGQAFFKITKNPKRPFWVYTDYISTQVLGTSFMVKAFADAKSVKVEVKSGKVSVYRREDLERAKQEQHNELVGVILTPNQQVAYLKTEERLLKSIIEQPEMIVAVPVKEFSFEEAPIAEVFALLEKTYGLSVIYDAKNMEDCYLTANLSTESLYEKLNLICKITHSTYEIVDGQIIIHSKGCQ